MWSSVGPGKGEGVEEVKVGTSLVNEPGESVSLLLLQQEGLGLD